MVEVQEDLKQRGELLLPLLDEHKKRIYAGVEATVIGKGGVSIVAKTFGMSRNTVSQGKKEIDSIQTIDSERIRRPGGGRKRIIDKEPDVKTNLEKLIDPVTRGDPESPLRWTCKSTRNLSKELKAQGYSISHKAVAELLHELGYSLQANRKTDEGKEPPDRNAQFEYINALAEEYQLQKQPVISVDTKKKELIGNYKNNGQEWEQKKTPIKVNTHDFPNKESGKVSPYGVYDIAENIASVNVGISSDTAEFAVESIERWWNNMGKDKYEKSTKLLITADAGGSNSSKGKLWKKSLQDLSNKTGLEITVCHFPPGTSKWNKIEHRLFCHISQNWRGKPLTSREVVVNLIASTRTERGLKVKCQLDENIYEKGKKISDEEMKSLNIQHHSFCEKWNYTIYPSK